MITPHSARSERLPHHPHLPLCIMAVEGKDDGGVVPSQYPGSNLSVSELCHALRMKIAQTRDPEYVHSSPSDLKATVTNLTHHSRYSSPIPLVRIPQ